MNIHDATEIAYRNGYADSRRACEAEIMQLSEKYQRLEKELNAAVSDIPRGCWSCKSSKSKEKCDSCNRIIGYYPAWEWRGIDGNT